MTSAPSGPSFRWGRRRRPGRPGCDVHVDEGVPGPAKTANLADSRRPTGRPGSARPRQGGPGRRPGLIADSAPPSRSGTRTWNQRMISGSATAPDTTRPIGTVHARTTPAGGGRAAGRRRPRRLNSAGRPDPVPALLDKAPCPGSWPRRWPPAAGARASAKDRWYDEHVKVHEYAGMTATAREIRAHGCPVLLSGPFTQQIHDAARWRSWVADLGGPPVRLVWVRRTRPPCASASPRAVPPGHGQAGGSSPSSRPACGWTSRPTCRTRHRQPADRRRVTARPGARADHRRPS